MSFIITASVKNLKYFVKYDIENKAYWKTGDLQGLKSNGTMFKFRHEAETCLQLSKHYLKHPLEVIEL